MRSSLKNKYLINQPKYKGNDSPPLLRIEFNPDYTKFDFGYQNDKYGWVRISPKTFVRIQTTREKYTLTRAENIPLTPTHHNFNTYKDWLYFSLYFPPIELKKGKLDLIEAEPGRKNDFNYFDIVIDPKSFIELM